MACPEGLEPPTCCLEGSCSIQLSYGQQVWKRKRDGRGERIRTFDPLLPKQLRYQAALHPERRIVPSGVDCARRRPAAAGKTCTRAELFSYAQRRSGGPPGTDRADHAAPVADGLVGPDLCGVDQCV